MLDEKRTFRFPKKVNHSFLFSEQCNELIFVPSTLIRKKKTRKFFCKQWQTVSALKIKCCKVYTANFSTQRVSCNPRLVNPYKNN